MNKNFNEKNFNVIHVGGCYRTKSEGNWVVMPENITEDHTGQTEGHVCYAQRSLKNEYPDWMPIKKDGSCYVPEYNFVEYLGEWDFDKCKFIEDFNPYKEVGDIDDIKDEDFLVESKTVEVVDVYEHGIFRAKVATRNNSDSETWVHFGSRNEFDDEIYGYTKNEFLSLMLILRQIENKFLEEDN